MGNILLQIDNVIPDSVAVSKIKAVSGTIKPHIETITNPDSLKNLSPSKAMSGLQNLDWGEVFTTLANEAVSLTLRIAAAIVIFYVGKFIINKLHRLIRSVLTKKNVDPSLTSFLLSFIRVTLLFVLIITVIDVLGIETSSFIAIFASAGVAIGLALSGTLQNFAGGVVLLLLKPYKTGDYIEYEQYKGVVRGVRMFHTVITTLNNERIIIPNGGLSSGIINNYTAEKYRRVEWRVAISYGDDVDMARKTILDIFDKDNRIITPATTVAEDSSDEIETPATEVKKKTGIFKRIFSRKKDDDVAPHNSNAILHIKLNFTPIVAVEELADSSVTLVVRAWCESQHYWNVLYDINEQIYKQLPLHGLHFPFPQLDVHVQQQ